MIGVVQTNGHKFIDVVHRAAQTGIAFDQGEFAGFELGQFVQHFVTQLLGANVRHHVTQISQMTFCIDESGFFFAGLAVTNEFHE